jgi:hypothetical protein
MSNAGNKRKLGCISFGYIFFVQAKKSNSPRGEIKCRNRAPNHPKKYQLELHSKCITPAASYASFGKQRKVTHLEAKLNAETEHRTIQTNTN